jgi:carboxymethylenebutenolidase
MFIGRSRGRHDNFGLPPLESAVGIRTQEVAMTSGTSASNVSFKRPDGKSVPGYLAEPGRAAGAPGVVVIQEWWGLNAQIRGVADRLAGAGFAALVPDLYRGRSTVEAEEAHHLMEGLNFADAAAQDVRGAVQHLKARGAKVGVCGFCMGGALTLLAACNAPEIDAGVVWYGCPPLDYIDAAKIKAPLLGHWATQDEFFPIANVDGLEVKLRDAGVRFEFHRYLAYHAFANETAVGPGRIPQTQYDPVWSQLAWDRSLAFLARTLG